MQQCPECGSTDMGKGKFTGYANLRPVGKLSTGSEVQALVCTSCGHIVSMKVKNPRKFR